MLKECVSFEVAKLLREKGFDWKTEFVWYEHLPSSLDWRNKTNQKAIDYFYFNETTEHHSYYRNCDKKPSYINGDIYSAPTQQLAMRWLREVHKIDISVTPDDGSWWIKITELESWSSVFNGKVLNSDDIKFAYQGNISTKEECYEAALWYVLKNLI